MPTPLRRRLRFARRGLAYTAALVLVLVALLLAAASQVLPMVESHPDHVARWLSERAGRPVAFDRVETRWTRRGPLLQLDGLRVGEGAQAFTVGDAEMLVSVYAGLLPGHAFTELRLRGLDLTLERSQDGRWQVRGLPGQQQAAGDPFAALEGLGELQVIGARMAVVAPSLGLQAKVPRIDVRLRVDGDRLRAGVRAWPPAGVAPGVAPVEGALDFNRRSGDGEAFAGAAKVDLAGWASLLDIRGIALEQGSGRARAWARLRGKRVESITVDVDLAGIALRGAPIEAGGPPTRHRYTQLRALARWQAVEQGWRLDAPQLRFGEGGRRHRLDGLFLADGEQYALRARQVDAGPLLAALTLSDRVPRDLRRWIAAARPAATLHDIDIVGRRGGALHASGRIAGLGFRPVGRSPGMHGMGAAILGDSDGFTLAFDPRATVRFDWPTGFGVVHAVKLRGQAGAWREGQGWRVGTHALRIDGRDFGVNARGGLWWQGDGTRPWIDVAAEVDRTVIPVGKGFWLRQDMPAAAVNWLDMALVAGELHDGRAVISGDLDQWPFGKDRPGFFEATGKIRDATIRFQEGWLPATDVDVDALFTAQGFEATGTGQLGGVAIERLRAGIDSYRGGALTVDATGAGDAAQLLEVLRRSPLQKEHADTLANVSGAGDADVGFALKLPLSHEGGGPTIDGTVALKNARLADKRWRLAFDQVSGAATYSRAGFVARGLAVRHENEPGRLSLRAGAPYVDQAGHVFEADLEASLGAAGLIGRAEDLAWLKPYLDGRSQWTVGIAIPKTAPGATPPTKLQLRSDLVGTRLDLPAPLRKPAAAPLAARIDTTLPLGTGDIEVGLGNVLALRARSSNGQTGVRVELGRAAVEEAPPTSGLVAVGQAERLDAIDWIALARGGDGGSRLPLQRIDITAGRLLLLGGSFPDARVRVVPAARGAIAVQAEGRALQGALLVPADANEAIAGKFERVHWRSPASPAPDRAAVDTVASAAAPSTPASSAPLSTQGGARRDEDIDPSRIPALLIEVQDLRVADAALGVASIRTRPSGNGMRIEQVQTRSPQHRLDLSGDWAGRGGHARTHLALDIDSKDYGSLLTGLGIGGRIGGGEGRVRFDAAWPGSPLVFKLESLEGSLVLDTSDGRLLEVEPGAGRVLGLLSLAQIPRRLSLDFRDLFAKGFAFNKLGGTVRFGNGLARSEDLVIDGPAATIDIRGAADLRAQRYDQTIEVRPKAGNLLTAIGAVAGGPVGAAIGAAANVVLNKPLGSLAARTYRVTGPWKEPKVEVVSREQSRATTATAAVPPG